MELLRYKRGLREGLWLNQIKDMPCHFQAADVPLQTRSPENDPGCMLDLIRFGARKARVEPLRCERGLREGLGFIYKRRTNYRTEAPTPLS